MKNNKKAYIDRKRVKNLLVLSLIYSIGYILIGFMLNYENLLIYAIVIFLATFLIMFILISIIVYMRIDCKNFNPYRGTKLTFKSKMFWIAMLTPGLIVLSILIIIALRTGTISYLFKDYSILKIFIGCCFFGVIFGCLIDGIQAEAKKFMKESKKGKIISVIILIVLLIKVLLAIKYQ